MTSPNTSFKAKTYWPSRPSTKIGSLGLLARHAQDRRQQCAELRDRLMTCGTWGELVQDYLGGRVSFNELEWRVYDQCPSPALQLGSGDPPQAL
jgi:hypothetical protein